MSDLPPAEFEETCEGTEEECSATESTEMMESESNSGISVFPASLLAFFTGVQFILPLTFYIVDVSK